MKIRNGYLQSLFRNKSLKQILVVLLLLILSIEAAVCFVVIRITQNSMSSEAVKNSEILLEYYSDQLEAQMDFAQKELKLLANGHGLLYSGSYENPLEQQYFEKLHMKKYMNRVLELNSILDGVLVFIPEADTNPYYAISSRYTNYNEELDLKELITTCNISQMAGKWLFQLIDDREYLLHLEEGIYGWYGIWIKAQSILQNFELLNPQSQSGLYVCNLNGTILESQSVFNFTGSFSQTDNGSTVRIDGERYIKVVSRANQEEYVLAALLPENEIMEEMRAIRPVLVATIITNLFLLILCIFCMKRFFYEPLHYLTDHFETVKRGNLESEIKLGSHLSEFEAVYSEFNEMQKSIVALKLDNYERKLHEEQAKRQFLQSQIKSHFFLNCLNIIYMLAQGKNYELIQKLDLCMANYMRYLTRPAEEPVMLFQELDHIRNYMTIQTMRYHDRITFSCEVKNEELDRCHIYPLMIQTFVENSMKYAMNPEKEDNTISVRIEYAQGSKGMLSILIEDSGPGFSEELLKKLRSDSSMPVSGLSGIGIANVKCRMELFYGNAGKILFSNGESHGAKVELFIPVHF